MKKQLLNSEFLKMQKIAGIITEAQYNEKKILIEDQSDKLKEIYNALSSDSNIGKHMKGMSTFELPKEFFEDYLNIISTKTNIDMDKVREVFLTPTVGDIKNDKYTNGWFMNGFEVLQTGLKKL
jgi:hypothetical protein